MLIVRIPCERSRAACSRIFSFQLHSEIRRRLLLEGYGVASKMDLKDVE